MRKVFSFISVIMTAFFLYKRRYQMVNKLMKIPYLRKYVVRLSMKIPTFRSRLLPSLFDHGNEY